MSREIKFRAWDQERKAMVDGNEIEEAEQPYEEEGCYIAQITRYQTGLSYGKVFIAYIDKRGDFTECEVMQFTGLLDRNGKEIYEGDILRNNCDMTFPITVDGLHGYRFMFGVDNLTAYDSKGEVIGNIYENPELLEKK